MLQRPCYSRSLLFFFFSGVSMNSLSKTSSTKSSLPSSSSLRWSCRSSTPKFFTAYGPKTKIPLDFSSTAGRTKQSFAAECDVNNIMARYQKTGVLEFAKKNEPRYGDCTGLEFQAGMELIANAKSMFAEMPSSLRARFENDPAKFFDFVQNDKNAEECVQLGLAKPKAKALPPSHREDGSATHEPLRAPDGTYREHTRKEKREEAKAQKASDDARDH